MHPYKNIGTTWPLFEFLGSKSMWVVKLCLIFNNSRLYVLSSEWTIKQVARHMYGVHWNALHSIVSTWAGQHSWRNRYSAVMFKSFQWQQAARNSVWFQWNLEKVNTNTLKMAFVHTWVELYYEKKDGHEHYLQM